MHSALVVIWGEGENVGTVRRDDRGFFTSCAPVPLPIDRSTTWVRKQGRVNRQTPEVEVRESSRVVDKQLAYKNQCGGTTGIQQWESVGTRELINNAELRTEG